MRPVTVSEIKGPAFSSPVAGPQARSPVPGGRAICGFFGLYKYCTTVGGKSKLRSKFGGGQR